MAEASKAKPESKGGASSGAPARTNKIAWVIGWIGVPSLVVGTLFLAGVHVGARHPDMILSRAVLWASSAEAQLPPATPREAAPLSRQLYLLALPTKEFGLQVELTTEDVARLAPDIDPKALDCETLCARVWTDQHPDKEFVETKACSASDGGTVTGTLECELVVER